VRRSTIQRKRYANTTLALEAQVIEPVTYEEASQGSEWKKAMDEEIHALKENQTWDLVAKPAGVKAHILQMGLQGNDMFRWIYRKI